MIWCLHGAVGLADDWAASAAAWREAGHEVAAVDLWEFQEGEGSTFAGFAELFAGRVQPRGGPHFLVGYSMGGRLALHALLARPALWAGAVIVSAHPGLSGERERVERMAADAGWAALALAGDWGSFLRNWEGQGILRGAGMPERTGLESRRQAVARSFMHWSLGKQGDLRGRLHEVRCPVLWVTGEEDEKFCRLAGEVQDLNDRFQHHVAPGAGHRLPWERPDEFRELVKLFLEGL